MLSVDDYLDRAKSLQKIKSDNKLAKRLGITSASCSQYRLKRAWPSDQTMINIADLCQMDRGQALIDLNLWRSQTAQTQAEYKKMRQDYIDNNPHVMRMMIATALHQPDQPAEQRAE